MRIEDGTEPAHYHTQSLRGAGHMPAWQGLLAIAIGVGLIALLMYELTGPVRTLVGERFVRRGDQYLAAQDFSEAETQYAEALRYDPGNTIATRRKLIADKAPTDIAIAADFFQQHGVAAPLQKLARAQQTYADPKEALAVGAQFYDMGEIVYAQYPLKRAVQLDPEYAEAWHYLALTYADLAKTDASYQDKADQALARQNALTPKYLKLP
jgi:Tfp pilus assembly protein PilF